MIRLRFLHPWSRQTVKGKSNVSPRFLSHSLPSLLWYLVTDLLVCFVIMSMQHVYVAPAHPESASIQSLALMPRDYYSYHFSFSCQVKANLFHCNFTSLCRLYVWVRVCPTISGSQGSRTNQLRQSSSANLSLFIDAATSRFSTSCYSSAFLHMISHFLTVFLSK